MHLMTRSDDRPERTLHRRRPVAPPPAGLAWIRALSAILCLIVLVGAAAPALADAGSTFVLRDELRATLDDDANLVLWTDRWVGDRPLLEIASPWKSRRRGLLGGAPGPVLRMTHEGADGGHRGFSRHADDDGDGAIDEDRLDGLDNDGDGRVDEDFAAVSDAMHVVHLRAADAALHLETYHWSYDHLRDVVVLAWSRESDAASGGSSDAVLKLPVSRWVEGPLAWGDAETRERTIVFARVADARGAWWIGATVLEGEPLLSLDGAELRVPVSGAVTVAIAATPSLTRLRCRLAAAVTLHDGALSAPGGSRVSWIVPPPVRVEDDFALTAVHRPAEGGGTELAITSATGWPLLPDPSSLIAAGDALGAPRTVSWEPADQDADSWTVDWPSGDPMVSNATRSVDHLALFDAVRGAGPGAWRLTYDRALPATAELGLEITAVCGRTFEAVSVYETPVIAVVKAEDPLGDSGSGPSLAPRLLENYPNPFKDHVSMRFRVPATVEEGFVWEKDEEPLLAPTDPIPYTSPTPRVTLKVYNVAGHEVATVFDEMCGPGERAASWNGCDITGRPVAAGTYFCKLQIDHWSVTKRVALIR